MDSAGVTFYPAGHPAKPFQSLPVLELGVNPSKSTLESVRGRDRTPCVDEVWQSSLPQTANNGDNPYIPQANGFVHTVLEAYNKHRALIIRPDDVWIAILTQFNLFVNGNAEELRSLFVAHEGKKELVVSAPGNRHSVNFGELAQQMTKLIHENVIDPDLQTWIMPDFTTTTFTDTTASAVIMMGTLKEYFSYKMRMCCGIPQVTLKGAKADWEAILGRIEKLKNYGVETIAWYHLLRPIITRFVAAFDNPAADENLHFWNKVCHVQSLGSGGTFLSGWITAFCAFGEKGGWQGDSFKSNPKTLRSQIQEASQLSASEFWQNHCDTSRQTYKRGREPLYLDDTLYKEIGISQVPPGVVEVDVDVDDNGELFPCVMTAGLAAMAVSSSGNKDLSGTGDNDTVSPVPAWWIWTKSDRDPQAEMREQIRQMMEQFESSQLSRNGVVNTGPEL